MPNRFDGHGFDQGGGWGEAPAIVLPRHLDRALAFARFTPPECIILQQVREACCMEAVGYPWSPDATCWLNLDALAESSGIPWPVWSAARRRLVASRVLIEDDDGELRINDRVGEWIDPGSGRPRLTAKLLAFCRASQTQGGEDER